MSQVRTIPMRPRRLRRMLAVVGAVGALTVTGIGWAAQADADTPEEYAVENAHAVCAVLDKYPTIAGVTGILQGVMEDGFEAYDAGRIVGIAVALDCPRHQPVLDDFVDRYAPADGRRMVA